jgi:hypothetical protein
LVALSRAEPGSVFGSAAALIASFVFYFGATRDLRREVSGIARLMSSRDATAGLTTRCRDNPGHDLKCCKGGKKFVGNPKARGEAPEGGARVEETTRGTRQTGSP